jgi:hypothetical protein
VSAGAEFELLVWGANFKKKKKKIERRKLIFKGLLYIYIYIYIYSVFKQFFKFFLKISIQPLKPQRLPSVSGISFYRLKTNTDKI